MLMFSKQKLIPSINIVCYLYNDPGHENHFANRRHHLPKFIESTKNQLRFSFLSFFQILCIKKAQEKYSSQIYMK